MNRYSKYLLCLSAILAAPAGAEAGLRVMERVTADVELHAFDDLHVTVPASAIAAGATVDLSDSGCRLFFDNIRPTDVLEKYSGSIIVGGEKLEPEINARICVYRHGTEILPHGPSYTPLVGYGLADFGGDKESYLPGYYYSNSPSHDVAAENIKPLAMNGRMRSFRLLCLTCNAWSAMPSQTRQGHKKYQHNIILNNQYQPSFF